MKKQLFMGTAIVLSGLLFSACIPGITKVENSEKTTMEEDASLINESESMEKESSETVEVMEKDSNVVEVTMDTGEFFFKPNIIQAKPGQTVEVTLTNTGGAMLHDFMIDELDVATKQIKKGEQDVVSFVVPESAAGKEFEFYCSVGQHRAQGMVGTLVVSE